MARVISMSDAINEAMKLAFIEDIEESALHQKIFTVVS